ncbi:threonine aldolase family protein [Paenibacillus sp. sgz500958]|uniref:threonine aldolase family protein n=1 Tax=Paenibacillus sp. sgz500958 TaxID=3242475 RepID=UPI0036D4337D
MKENQSNPTESKEIQSKDTKSLQEGFNHAAYPLPGHGKRNIAVLQDAFHDIDGDLDSDVYGKGKLIEEFQEKMAGVLGKESAVFFPSGTMAQQIALRIWCDHKGLKKVAYHPLCHLEIHEQDGLKELHHIQPVLLADKDRLITLEDVMNLKEEISCLLLELPQREIGGQLPEYGELENISAYCRERGILLHLDGARLFEVLPYYGKSAAEICALFDSVYISFYKGIGGIAGAILAGNKEFTEESKVWKRRHGGDLISLYPYITTADYYYEQRVHRMGQYYEEAKELASYFNGCHSVETLPLTPVSNMFHVHFALPKEKVEPVLASLYEETGIGLTQSLREKDESSCYYEMSIGDRYAGVPKEKLRGAFEILDQKMKEASSLL